MKFTHSTLALFAILSMVGCTTATDDKTYDYQLYGLNCPVQMVQVKAYEAESKFGEIVKGDLEWNGHYMAIFNPVGNLDTIKEFDDDGDLYGLERYKYNDEGKLVEVSAYDEDGSLDYRTDFEFDASGEIVKQTTTAPSYWRDTPTTQTLEFVRTENGLVEERLSKNDRLLAVLKYSKNDSTGTEYIIYDQKSNETRKGYTLLDEKGRVVEECEGDDVVCKIKWNEKNLPVYMENYTLYRNQILKMEGEMYFVEYEYDQQGNWVKQIIYEGVLKTPKTIHERVIIY